MVGSPPLSEMLNPLPDSAFASRTIRNMTSSDRVGSTILWMVQKGQARLQRPLKMT